MFRESTLDPTFSIQVDLPWQISFSLKLTQAHKNTHTKGNCDATSIFSFIKSERRHQDKDIEQQSYGKHVQEVLRTKD